MLDWDDLKFVLAVARSGAALSASYELKVNQTTVTRRIARIEGAVGSPLFERHQSGYVIHHAAEAPETSLLAARELQRVIEKATGVSLTITSDPVTTPAIRLIQDNTLPHDGYEIRGMGAGDYKRRCQYTNAAAPRV